MAKSTADVLAEGAKGAFHTTHWTVVLKAASPEPAESNEAFGQLYLDYWYPLYAYARRRGHSPHDAEDITQDFFTRLIEKQSLAGVAREGGRFRSFLLTSLAHFLANEWDHAQAQKRGGGAPGLPLDAADAEARYSSAVLDTVTPETVFEQNWTLTLLENVLAHLRAECETTGKTALFEDLRPHLQGDRQGPAYAEISARHGLSEGAVKVAVHRMRRRYGELLRAEIARTVGTESEIEEELRHLIRVVGR